MESGRESSMESSTVELCRHVFTDGRACKGAAVRGRIFCRHHREIKKTIYCMTPEPDPYRVHPPMGLRFPEDGQLLQPTAALLRTEPEARPAIPQRSSRDGARPRV